MGKALAANRDQEVLNPSAILPTARKEADAAVSEASEALADLRAFVVASDEQAQILEQVAAESKRRWAAIEVRRKEIVDPINKAKEAVQALFKPALDHWRAVETAAKGKIVEWIRARELAAAEAARAAEAAFAQGSDGAELKALVTASAETVQHAEGTSVRKQWEAEVIDLATLVRAVADGKAPLSLLTVDPSALRAFARGTRGSVPVPGLRFFQKTIVGVSTK